MELKMEKIALLILVPRNRKADKERGGGGGWRIQSKKGGVTLSDASSARAQEGMAGVHPCSP